MGRSYLRWSVRLTQWYLLPLAAIVTQVALCALVCGSGLCGRADGQLCRDLGKHRGSQVFVKLLKEKLQYFHQNFDGHSLF